jgi:hypothetical protein
MTDSGIVCDRCKKPAGKLVRMPLLLRLLMLPGKLFFPFSPDDMYCRKCRRAMAAPILFLLAIAIVLLVVTVRRWLQA